MIDGEPSELGLPLVKVSSELGMTGIDHEDYLRKVEEQGDRVKEVAVGGAGPNPKVVECRPEDGRAKEQVGDQEAIAHI